MEKIEEIEKKLDINPEKVKTNIFEFIENIADQAGVEGAVIGLSGGLDSSTVSFLTSEVLGSDNVLTIYMPEKGISSEKSSEHSQKVVDELGTEYEEVEISPILEEFREKIDYDESDKLSNANLKPRTRMAILYYYANKNDYLVVGPSNKSEIKCGYFTKYGDGAADFFPIGSLYKTQVKKLAQEMGVPKEIIQKKPSAGLWKGQKDEDELGLTYQKIDKIYAGLELGYKNGEIADALDIDESKIREFRLREKNSQHKLEKPPVPEL